MSRLEEECIVYIGRNRSGMDAGEIDHGILSYKFEGLHEPSLRIMQRELDFLHKRCEERIAEIKKCNHVEYKKVSNPDRATVYECKSCRLRTGPTPFHAGGI
jgi:hypothetical protein